MLEATTITDYLNTIPQQVLFAIWLAGSILSYLGIRYFNPEGHIEVPVAVFMLACWPIILSGALIIAPIAAFFYILHYVGNKVAIKGMQRQRQRKLKNGN